MLKTGIHVELAFGDYSFVKLGLGLSMAEFKKRGSLPRSF